VSCHSGIIVSILIELGSHIQTSQAVRWNLLLVVGGPVLGSNVVVDSNLCGADDEMPRMTGGGK
jgi:hypothetical protein